MVVLRIMVLRISGAPELDLERARRDLLEKLGRHRPDDGLSEVLRRATDLYLQLRPTDTEVRQARDLALRDG